MYLRHDNHYVIETYIHRFGRQIGFYQDVSGELEPQKHATNERLFNLFSSIIHLGTKSSFLIPGRCASTQARTTPVFVSH